MRGVFISYRRNDGETIAERLYDILVARLGSRRVFLDRKGIPGGADFGEELRRRLEASDITIVVIGEHWPVHRLHDDKDWVRFEIREALRRKHVVIPLLLPSAKMPEASSIPVDIAEFCAKNASVVTDLTRDVHRLADTIDIRVPVVEGGILMGVASAAATLIRANLQREGFDLRNIMEPKPQRCSPPEDCMISIRTGDEAFFPHEYYPALGTTLYYLLLILGIGLAVRRRLGWTIEEIARVATCAGIGAGIGHLLNWFVATHVFCRQDGSQVAYGAWFLGLAIGLCFGLARFAPISPQPWWRMLLIASAVAALAATGGYLESIPQVQIPENLRLLIIRSWLWIPIVIGVSVLVGVRYPDKSGQLRTILRISIPIVAAMIAADLFSSLLILQPEMSPTNILRVRGSASLKFAWDNGVFYGTSMAVLAWTANREARSRLAQRSDGWRPRKWCKSFAARRDA